MKCERVNGTLQMWAEPLHVCVRALPLWYQAVFQRRARQLPLGAAEVPVGEGRVLEDPDKKSMGAAMSKATATRNSSDRLLHNWP